MSATAKARDGRPIEDAVGLGSKKGSKGASQRTRVLSVCMHVAKF